MSRPRTVDRDRLLNAANAVIAASGVAALSFGSVATAAGLSKATVQSAFGTREAMIAALLERWLEQEQARFEAMVGPAPTALDRVRGHLASVVEDTQESSDRFAALVAALAGTGEQGRAVEAWYRARMGDLSAPEAEAKRARIAYLAAEGAFFLRHLVGFPLSDETWADVFSDLRRVVDDEPL